jgi:hypothetical protein
MDMKTLKALFSLGSLDLVLGQTEKLVEDERDSGRILFPT